MSFWKQFGGAGCYLYTASGRWLPFDREYLQSLKNSPSKPKLVLYEEDPYGHIVKPMRTTFKAVLAESDICFLGGTGYIAEMAYKAGAKKIRYALHSFDSKRFGTPWKSTILGDLCCHDCCNSYCPQTSSPGYLCRAGVAENKPPKRFISTSANVL